MAIQVTNTNASQALRGQSVKVTLSGSEAISKLPLLYVGMSASIVNGGRQGIINQIDQYGNSFEMSPLMPTGNLSSESTPGYLKESELINIETE